MAAPQAVEALSQRASFLRETLERSRSNTETMVAMLGSFDDRLSALESGMRPTQVRTHAIRMAHENVDKALKATAVLLTHFEFLRQAEVAILRGPHEDLESFLDAVDQLKSIIKFFTSNKISVSSDGLINHANNLLSKAIIKIREEFAQILATYSKPIELECLSDCPSNLLQSSPETVGNYAGSDNNVPAKSHSEHQARNMETPLYKAPTLIPPRIIPLLRNLASQLVQAGYQQQCSRIYSESRGSSLESSLQKLGVDNLNKDDVQKMQWDSLETKIQDWIHFMQIVVNLLFVAERKICDQIFDGITFNKDLCFAEVTVNSVSMLLTFGDSVAKSKTSPEKIFPFLDMYEVLHALQPEVNKIFDGKACSEMWESTLSLAKRLAHSVKRTLIDFQEIVENDSTKTMVSDGTVHPLSSYVINYMKFLFDYRPTMELILQEVEIGNQTGSQLATMTMRIMQALQNSLDGKSKQYKEPALSYLFLMNNIHYMVKSLSRSEAKDLLGDDWIQKHRRIVQQNANQYKRVAWAKILHTLSVQGLTSLGSSSALGAEGGSSSGISRSLIKERFKSFNLQFEELHQRQSQWLVPDSELREYLRLSVAEVLLPAYRSFSKRFGLLVENGSNPQKYIRYTPEDLERMLGEFFEGKTSGEPKR
ncbi:exocyst complex component EXO70A1-like [Canna indica]|uniref:Exocyst subunit Exo70 family protein n=1 Tax=Canna indica TaxID=4628 RepID=A0AAQ3JW98_9LILI|nr:exocyst complex component EXO70A1-like [Canna indica]